MGKRSFRRTQVLTVCIALALAAAACGKNIEIGSHLPSGLTPIPSGAPTSVPTVPPATPTVTSSSAPTPTGSLTFNGNGVTFQYPNNWIQLSPTGAPTLPGTQNWTQTLGIDGSDFSTVAQYTNTTSVTTATISQQTPAITTQMQAVFQSVGGSMQGNATTVTVAGFPGLSFTGTAVDANAQSVRMRFVLAFNGTIEYAVSCQAIAENIAVIDAGCTQIVSTLAVG